MYKAAFDQPTPLIGGRLGAVEYRGDLQVPASPSAYPYAIGPHIGSRLPDQRPRLCSAAASGHLLRDRCRIRPG